MWHNFQTSFNDILRRNHPQNSTQSQQKQLAKQAVTQLVNHRFGFANRRRVSAFKIIHHISPDQRVGFGFAIDFFLDEC